MSRGGTMNYGEAKRRAADPDVNVRRALASRSDLPREILYFLAEDDSPEVRRAVARNSATPPQASLLLARDQDLDVRCDLAAMIARVAPSLTSRERKRIGKKLRQALDVLASDQIVRVRRILAESIRNLTNAPRAVVRRLAEDTELSVAGPVLDCSPVLTEQDLLAVIHESRVRGALSAISRRSSLGPSLVDAIAETDVEEAIATLLGNRSAQIREATLDSLIERAPEHDSWHDPLVRRPSLPPRAAVRLASFVAGRFIGVLRKRGDLSAEALDLVEREVTRRIEAGETTLADPFDADGEGAKERVRSMHDRGLLNATFLRHAIDQGDEHMLAAGLSLLARLENIQVRRALIARDPKGLTAITWAAGLPMDFAVQLQSQFAKIAKNAVIKPTKDGGYPLGEAEMLWQLELFKG